MISIQMLDVVKKAAYEIIMSDLRYINTLVALRGIVQSNYICMSMPYIGLFVDGVEQWCNNIGYEIPQLSEKEKKYYAEMRLSVKMFDPQYNFGDALLKIYKESDSYFSRKTLFQKKYYNVGTDIYEGDYCGNTLLCSLYIPNYSFDEVGGGYRIKKYSIIAGKIAACLGIKDLTVIPHGSSSPTMKDYHFYDDSPIKVCNHIGLVLFCVLCALCFVTSFIEKYFTEEIPQKFKFAYLQYYYLCDYIHRINLELDGKKLYLDDSLKNKELRNCLAHYGISNLMKAKDIDNKDPLIGLTKKALGKGYYEAKEALYSYLEDLVHQIKEILFV